MRRPSLLEQEGLTHEEPISKAGGQPRDHRATVKVVVAIVAIVAAAAWGVYNFSSRAPDIGDLTRYLVVIDADTGEVNERFDLRATKETFPWANAAGKKSLYPAEYCFWNRDGSAKVKPTFVLLNQFKGLSGDTICPDCGRKVVPRNPAPPPELMAKAYEDAAK